MADYLTFANLMDETQRVIKHFKQAQEGMVKHVINMVYLNEVICCDDLFPPFWMIDFDDSLGSKDEMTITGISQASPGVVTAANTLVEGDIVTLYGIVGMTQLNNRTFRVGSAAQGLLATAFPLTDLDGTVVSTASMTAYSSGGTAHHRGITLATTGKNVQSILSARWHGEDLITPIEIDELEGSSWFWDSGTQRPSRYWHRKSYTTAGAELNQLLWFQAADAAYDLRCWFQRRPSVLSADADVPMLPPQFHYAIVAGTVMRLAEFNVQVDNQLVWPGIYKQQIEDLKTFNRRWWERIKNENKGAPYLL